jgi:hypothetical protein
MRTLAIMALTLTLACCTGDRIKQGMNSPPEPFGISVKSERERNSGQIAAGYSESESGTGQTSENGAS